MTIQGLALFFFFDLLIFLSSFVQDICKSVPFLLIHEEALRQKKSLQCTNLYDLFIFQKQTPTIYGKFMNVIVSHLFWKLVRFKNHWILTTGSFDIHYCSFSRIFSCLFAMSIWLSNILSANGYIIDGFWGLYTIYYSTIFCNMMHWNTWTSCISLVPSCVFI